MAAPTSDSLLYAGHPEESHPAESSQPLRDLCVQTVQTRNGVFWKSQGKVVKNKRHFPVPKASCRLLLMFIPKHFS